MSHSINNIRDIGVEVRTAASTLTSSQPGAGSPSTEVCAATSSQLLLHSGPRPGADTKYGHLAVLSNNKAGMLLILVLLQDNTALHDQTG